MQQSADVSRIAIRLFGLLCAVIATCGNLLTAQDAVSSEQQPSAEARPVVSPSATPESTSQTAAASAKTLAGVLRKLRAVKTEEMDVDVPQQARSLIAEAKHQLRDLFQQVLTENPDAAAAQAKAKVLARLRQSGVSVAPPKEGTLSQYGFITELRVEQPVGHNNLIVFAPTFKIACGGDSALYVYQKRDNQWRLAIAVEVNGYKDIRDAGGTMQYQVPPSDTQDSWFLAYVYESPTCFGQNTSVGYGVLRASGDAYKPKILLQEAVSGDASQDEGPKLHAGKNSFHLDFGGSQTITPKSDVGYRWHNLNYRIEGEDVTRVQPFAYSPEGFLDEWIGSPWKDVASVSPDSQKIRQWHELLCCQKGGEYKRALVSLDFVQPCPGGNKWQLGLSFYWPEKDKRPDKKFYATVGGKKRPGKEKLLNYSLLDIGWKRAAGCPGESEPQGDIWNPSMGSDN